MKNARAEELLGVGGAVGDDGTGSAPGGGMLIDSDTLRWFWESVLEGSGGVEDLTVVGRGEAEKDDGAFCPVSMVNPGGTLGDRSS